MKLRGSVRCEAAIAFVILLAIVAAHTLMETARDALFLARLDASRLAWVYLITAALSVAITPVKTILFRGQGEARLLAGLLFVSAVVTLSFFWGSESPSTRYLYVLYVWSALFATLVIVQFWVLVGGAYTITEAKRFYGLIGAGAAAGALAGAGIARAITHVTTVRHLLLASGGLLVLSSFAVLLLPRLGGKVADKSVTLRRQYSISEGAGLLLHNSYVRGIFVIASASAIAFTLVDFIFKSAVQHAVAPNKLGSFFATTNLVLSFLGLVVQLGFGRRLVAWAGVIGAAAILPLFLMGGSLTLLAVPTFGVVFLLKGPDGAFRYSLHRTTLELFDVAIAEPVRSRAKELIGGVAHRGGQVLGSIIILAVLGLARPSWLLPILAIVATGWMAQTLLLRRHYLEVFRANLRRDDDSPPEIPTLDISALETFIAALNSEEDTEVIAALDILEEQHRAYLIPALILYHPSTPIVLRALEILSASGRRDFLPLAVRLQRHADAAIRAGALTAGASMGVTESALRSALRDPSPDVRAVALVHMVSRGRMDGVAAQGIVAEIADGGDVVTRRALARAIRRKPHPSFAEILTELGRTDDRDLAAEVAFAMAAAPDPVFISTLIRLLGRRRSMGPARAALVALGAPALAAVASALGSPLTPRGVRGHLPRTISRFPPTDAAPILMKHLRSESDGMVRYKILRGLGSLRAACPSVTLDNDALAAVGDETAAEVLQTRSWRIALEEGARVNPTRATAAHELLISLLADKERLALERLFRVLGLCEPGEDFESIYRGLLSDDADAHASSRELLDHLLEPKLRSTVLQLLEVRSTASSMNGAGDDRYEAILEELLRGSSESLRSLTAMHVGELGFTDLRQDLEIALAMDGGPGAELVAQAIASLRAIDRSPRLHA